MLLSQVEADRRRLKRGETVEACSPSGSLDAGPWMRERPLSRCHTLDTHIASTSECSVETRDKKTEPDGDQTARETQSTDGSTRTSSESSPSSSWDQSSHAEMAEHPASPDASTNVDAALEESPDKSSLSNVTYPV